MRSLILDFIQEQRRLNQELRTELGHVKLEQAVMKTKLIFYGSAASVLVGIATHLLLAKLK